MKKWQKRWDDQEDVAQWTKQIIPNIESWTERKHKEISHQITQTDLCMYCGDEEDTAAHTLYKCQRWNRDRVDVENMIGERLTPENTIRKMLESQYNWRTFAKYIHDVIDGKLRDEKIEQNETADAND